MQPTERTVSRSKLKKCGSRIIHVLDVESDECEMTISKMAGVVNKSKRSLLRPIMSSTSGLRFAGAGAF